MARNRGIFNFSANLEVKKNAPLDSRVVVDTIIELTETSTWADSDNKVWLYDGIVVSVRENHGLYMLTNYDAVTAPTAYTNSDNWVAVDATAAQGEKADTALQSITKGTDGSYVTTIVGTKDNNSQTVATSVTVLAISSASSKAKGLAEASDVKAYVDALFAWEEL